jgi:hypothetical protein
VSSVLAGVRDEIESGRERVEEWRESALEARRESAGESGAGREEVSESHDGRNEEREGDLGLPRDGFGASSGELVEMKDKEGVAVVGPHRSAAGGLWALRGGVEGERDVPPASSSGVDRVLEPPASKVPSWLAMGASDPAPLSNDTVGVVWPFTVAALESGWSGSEAWEIARPLLVMVPLVMTSALSLRSSVSGTDCDLAVAVAVATPTGWVDATVSWSALLPTFILESVDLRFDNGATRAYSCADGTGGGKKGDPGEGKGDDDDSLLVVTVSGGVISDGRASSYVWLTGFGAYLLSRD